jgi:malate dehydrogenase
MPVIAIIGAGALGGALAHKLAGRGRVAEVRLIDAAESVARGKALDILQSGPVEGFATRVSADSSILAAAGADAIVFADDVSGAEHAGEAGLAVVRQLVGAGAAAPFVFAGVQQRQLMSRCVTELHIPPARIIGAAPTALSSAVRAISALTLDTSPVELSLLVVGVPPRYAVVAWEGASSAGRALRDVLAPHEVAAVAARVPGLWPPGAYGLASAAARVAEAVCLGSRRQFSCFVDAGRGRIVALPVELERGGIKRVLEPSLTSQERTLLETALSMSP